MDTRSKKKKLFTLTHIILILLSIGFPGAALSADTAEPNAQRKGNIGDAFVDEELVYRIGVLIFDDAAVGRVSLKKGEGGEYIATINAHTIGVIDKVYHRQDTYTSHIRVAEDGSRFITMAFEKTIDINGRVRKGITTFDYEKHTMTWKSWGGGKEDKEDKLDILGGAYYDDPLAAFYNFRYGVYGPLKEGMVYNIPSFPKKDRIPEISLRIVTKEEMEKRMSGKKVFADYLADVKIDKELFASGSGEVEILFTDALIPVEAVAKGIAFFGDVRGKLSEFGVSMDFNTKTPLNASTVAIP